MLPSDFQTNSQPNPESQPNPDDAPVRKGLSLSRKTVLLIVGFLLLGEIAWAGWTLTRGDTQAETVAAPAVSSTPAAPLGEVILAADKTVVRKGDKFSLSVNVQSTVLTDGTDLIILYDPKLLSVMAEKGKKSVTVGKVYTDYPINTVDEKTGRIVVSGISSKDGGVLAEGVFGTVVFQAEEEGTANISLDFTPGSTTDSNIIEAESGRDILSKVNNLQVTITP